jgi:hypothetical protein
MINTFKSLVLLFALFNFQCFAQKSFVFPDESYAYAKLYYFNIQEIRTRPDDYIYSEESGFANSIVFEVEMRNSEIPNHISRMLANDKDGMLNGLSGCFIPRHGIVYFDKENKPIASISICFECEAIRLWTNKQGRIRSKNKKTIKDVEQKMFDLKTMFEKESIIVSEKLDDYISILQDNEAIPTITITMDSLPSEIVSVTFQDAQQWFTKHPEVDKTVKYTAGGDKYEFGTLKIDGNTKFLFMDVHPDSKLGEATIHSDVVVLPNGIKIGSSLEEVMNTLLIYDGPSNPEIITLKDKDYKKIVYTFEKNKVVKITINQ